jgi:hypothetical protein
VSLIPKLPLHPQSRFGAYRKRRRKECRSLARNAQNEEHRRQLLNMAVDFGLPVRASSGRTCPVRGQIFPASEVQSSKSLKDRAEILHVGLARPLLDPFTV